TLTNSAQVGTLGLASAALVAQSVGGGGGIADVAFSGAFDKGTPAGAGIVLGGTGAGIGAGGNVSVKNTALVTTGVASPAPSGDLAPAVLAQSIGGGGGDANLLLDFGVPTGGTATTGTVALAVGGAANASGIGGTVGVTDSASLQTAGAQSDGIDAQSIGGGGGNAAAVVDGTAQLAAGQTPSTYDLSIAVGGAGGQNAGGSVTVTHSGGTILTMGDGSAAIFAQSVGGGGGTGGSARSIVDAPAAGCSTGSATCSAQLLKLTLNVGGSGSGSSAGGGVSVTNTGALQTDGEDADAILAQSIGGGGGTAGDDHVAQPSPGPSGAPSTSQLASWSIHLGGAKGSSGNGGNVAVSQTGAILTKGDGSSAIVAQSVGGGGGIAGGGVSGTPDATGTISLGGSGGASGNGGSVTVTVANGPVDSS